MWLAFVSTSQEVNSKPSRFPGVFLTHVELFRTHMTVYTNAVTYKGPYVVYANKITQDKSWSLQKDKSRD